MIFFPLEIGTCGSYSHFENHQPNTNPLMKIDAINMLATQIN